MSLKMMLMQLRLKGLPFLKWINVTTALTGNNIFKMYCSGRTLTKNIIMNLNTESYKRKQKEKAVLTFYSVHNATALMGKNMKSGTRNGQYVSWPKNNTVKPGSPATGFG